LWAGVVADALEEEWKFERRRLGARAGYLGILPAWCAELGIQEAVTESALVQTQTDTEFESPNDFGRDSGDLHPAR
jgi:hypothetical protein